MEKLIAYYVKILLPIPVIVLFAKTEFTWVFLSLLALYIVIYRTIIDSSRLIEKGLIGKNEKWKLLIPFWRVKYLEELYFSK